MDKLNLMNLVHKDRLKNGYKSIIDKKLGNKNEKLIYSRSGEEIRKGYY